MKYLLLIVIIIVISLFFIKPQSNIHSGTSCYSEDSGSLKLGFFGINKNSIMDEDCRIIEAARLAAELGLEEHAKMLVCSHGGSVFSFGTAETCMDYMGNYQEILVEKNEREVYCENRSKKWYKKLWRKPAYKKCMNGY